MSKKTQVCLTMMVKNEAHIIERCLESVSDLIDYWVICDTGSTDGTQEIIQNFFDKKGITGELNQHVWENYGHNRTLTLECAKGKGDYLLLADADYIFHVDDVDFKDSLEGVAYNFYNISFPLKYKMLKLISGHEEWRYVGVTHEYIECVSSPGYTPQTINSFYVEELCDGGNRSDKFDNDIKLLRKGLKDEPNNSRYMFYLARSYDDIGKYKSAIHYYERRIKEGGWEEEVFYSLYSITCCKIKLGMSFAEISTSAFQAYELRPTRIESMYELVRYCRIKELYQTGYLIGKGLVDINVPADDALFIHNEIYEWMLKDEVSICAYYSGAYDDTVKLASDIVQLPQLSNDHKSRIEKNIQLGLAMQGEKQAA